MAWKLFCLGFLGCALIWAADLTDSNANMRSIAKGAFSGIQERTELVVTNQGQWEKIWQQHTALQEPKKDPPQVDFSKESVLFVCMGQKSSGGYSVEITGLRKKDGEVEVLLSEKSPPPGAITLAALTAPFHIVLVPKIEGRARFIKG